MSRAFVPFNLFPPFKNIGLTAEEAGNSPEMIAKHYKELVRPKAAAKFWQMGQPMSQAD